jgi:hypothetical protein
VRFGEKKIYLSCRNGGPDVRSVTVNGSAMNVTTSEEVALIYDALPVNATVEITTGGGWPADSCSVDYPEVPGLVSDKGTPGEVQADSGKVLKDPYRTLVKLHAHLVRETDAEFEQAFVAAALKSFEDCRVRGTMDPGPGYYRPITMVRRENIQRFYENAALGMYKGLATRMAGYSVKGDARQKHLAALFYEAQE